MSKKRPRDKPAAATAAAFATVFPVRSRFPLLVLRGTGFLMLLLAVFAWLRPELRVWGLHHLAFLPLPLALGLLAAALMMLSPWGGPVVDWLGRRLRMLAGRSALMWSVAAMALFLALRVSVPLLGDSSLWIKELSWLGAMEARGKDAPAGRWLLRKEPLELATHELLFRAVIQFRPREFPALTPEAEEARTKRQSKWHDTAASWTYAALSILAGGILVYLTLRFARRRVQPEMRTPFLLLLLAGSGMLLFFGYVENYAWMSLLVVAAMLSGIDESFRPRRFPLRTAILFLLAVAFHLLAVYLLPAILFLVLQRLNLPPLRGDDVTVVKRRGWMMAGGLLLAAAVSYVAVQGWKGWISVMPLLPARSRDGYAILSAAHALDLLNLLALSAVVPVAVLAGMRYLRVMNSQRLAQEIFLAFGAAGGIALALVFNPNLGMARDWDVVTAALWPLAVWGAWRLATSDLGTMRSGVIAALMAFALLIPLPFVLVQASEPASVRRFETLLQLDRSRAAYGWENLANYYEDHNDLDNRLRCWKAALECENNPRYQINVSIALRLKGDLEEAEKYCVEGARREPRFAHHLGYLSASWAKSGRLDKARDLLRLAAELDPGNKQIVQLLEKVERELARRDSTARAGP